MKRQLSDNEKRVVHQQQLEKDGVLRCFITGRVINVEDDEIEYDHILAYAKDGETDVSNIRIVLKEFNRRKSSQSLYEFRDLLTLEKLFEEKKNNVKLQDILSSKSIKLRAITSKITDNTIHLTDGDDNIETEIFFDEKIKVYYFYGRVPIKWLENDDQEGLQPRVIDLKRMLSLKEHLKEHPQLAPSIARLVGGRLKLFDGQHKLAAQVLNGADRVDLKVYISDENSDEKNLFEILMKTNLDAHSKLKQVPFYTSILLERMNEIYKGYWEEFISSKDISLHTEANFIHFLITQKNKSKSEAMELLRSSIIENAIDAEDIKKYVAVASKDANFPITIDLLKKTLFQACLYLEPSNSRINSEDDYRICEIQNFQSVMQLIFKSSNIDDWSPNTRGELQNNVVKARRIWFKGSVLTWSPYLKTVLRSSLNIATSRENEQMLYRKNISSEQLDVIKIRLDRLFNHPIWDSPQGEIDSILVSAKRQADYFEQKGLTENYVLYG